MSQQQSFIDKTIRDKDGKIALWQMPNPPLITWLAATLLATVITHGKPHTLFMVVAFGALFTWAWMEIFSGVNYARRALGVLVLLLSIYSKVK